MQRRQSVELDAKYHDLKDAAQSAAFDKQSYDFNRADSIEWACARCNDDDEIRECVFSLRRQLREQVVKAFPQEVVLVNLLTDNQDPNHFFVLVGSVADGKYGSGLGALALFFCEQLKGSLNLDLHPILFRTYSPQN